LNVFVAFDPSEALAHVKTQWLALVTADEPCPLRGLSVAPEGTLSFVQWTPLGTSNSTVIPVTAFDPFLKVIVPQ
jgi:hypothetical protein